MERDADARKNSERDSKDEDVNVIVLYVTCHGMRETGTRERERMGANSRLREIKVCIMGEYNVEP